MYMDACCGKLPPDLHVLVVLRTVCEAAPPANVQWTMSCHACLCTAALSPAPRRSHPPPLWRVVEDAGVAPWQGRRCSKPTKTATAGVSAAWCLQCRHSQQQQRPSLPCCAFRAGMSTCIPAHFQDTTCPAQPCRQQLRWQCRCMLTQRSKLADHFRLVSICVLLVLRGGFVGWRWIFCSSSKAFVLFDEMGNERPQLLALVATLPEKTYLQRQCSKCGTHIPRMGPPLAWLNFLASRVSASPC
ncbi:hypothetical protein COO60DRAFT_413104 [Scenedesmus sp. NREL 46B-D3]|nr:hypothetical protein COO60DRAFT_413104 [Scenedesmus sp. NREL 46B-D3]